MANPKRGRFITLEGGEGSGKSTLQLELVRRLDAAGIEVVATREPGGTPLAESIRALALHPPEGHEWSPLAEALLMNAARSDHLEKLIRPALMRGAWVVCDRFADSTRAYQSVNGGVSADILESMEKAVVRDTAPAMTFVLDISIDAAKRRRSARGAGTDTFEARPAAFHEAVRKSFLTIARDNPQRCVILDAGEPADQVADAAWSHLVERFALRNGAIA